MYTYRLTRAIVAVARDENDHAKLVTLVAGAIVQTRKEGAMLPATGLIEVIVDGQPLAAFRQDLDERGERVDSAESG